MSEFPISSFQPQPVPTHSVIFRLKKYGKLIAGTFALLVILGGTMIAYAYSAGLLGSTDNRQQAFNHQDLCAPNTNGGCGERGCKAYEKARCGGDFKWNCIETYECKKDNGTDCASGGNAACKSGFCDPSSHRCTDGGTGGTTREFIQDNPSAADYGSIPNPPGGSGGTSAPDSGVVGGTNYSGNAAQGRAACSTPGGGFRACVSPNSFALCTSAGYTEVQCPHGCSNGQCLCEGGYGSGAFLCRDSKRYQCIEGSDVPVDANGVYAPGNNTCAYGCSNSSCKSAPAAPTSECWVKNGSTCSGPNQMTTSACAAANGYATEEKCKATITPACDNTQYFCTDAEAAGYYIMEEKI